MKPKLLTLAAWSGFLVSAVSEYGLGEDFPLTPLLWLAIAVAVLLATNHASVGTLIRGNGRWETPVYQSGDAWLAPGSASFVGNANKSTPNRASLRTSGATDHRHLQSNRRLQDFTPDNCTITVSALPPSQLGGVIVTASDVLQAVSLLSPTTTRGPPWGGDQSLCLFDITSGQPARTFSTAPHPSKPQLSNSVLRNPTDQEPIRSASEGDQT